MVTRAIIVAVLALAAPDGASCLAAGASKLKKAIDVLPAEQCLPRAEPSHTLQGEDFYLVALEKK